MTSFFKLISLIAIVPLTMLIYNELLYFTGWKDNASIPNNKAPIHFYVINLDRQPERWSAFKSQADKFGIQVERISATDGYKAIFVDQATKIVFTGADVKAQTKLFEPHHKYDVYCSQEAYETKQAEFTYNAFEELKRPLTAGEIGIDCSTRLLWEKIASAPDDQIAVIFEDDAVLLDNFDTKFTKFVELLPEKWDIAYLDADLFYFKRHIPYSARFLLPLPDLVVNDYFIKIHNEHNVERIHAYAINKESAKKLIEAHDRDTSVPIDLTIAHAISKRFITTYIAKEKIASYNEALESDISAMGRKEFEKK